MNYYNKFPITYSRDSLDTACVASKTRNKSNYCDGVLGCARVLMRYFINIIRRMQLKEMNSLAINSAHVPQTANDKNARSTPLE